MTVKAATAWATNADLIADVAQLGYLNDDDHVLDPTFGRGVWWQKFRPKRLTTHDLAIDGIDFRDLPYDDDTFDVVAFDPPYVSVGGRKTTTMPDFHNRYGMTEAPTSPATLQDLINGGLTEAGRVVKSGGFVLVKVQDYVSSGKLWLGTYHTVVHGLDLGLTLVDRLEHIGRVRPQPPGRRQLHARRNLSTLLVFRSPISNLESVKRDQAKKRQLLQQIKIERGCADCGYNAHAAALDFDHRPGQIKSISIGRQLSNVGVARLLAEVEQCDVVCSNCHRIRSFNREQHRPGVKPKRKHNQGGLLK